MRVTHSCATLIEETPANSRNLLYRHSDTGRLNIWRKDRNSTIYLAKLNLIGRIKYVQLTNHSVDESDICNGNICSSFISILNPFLLFQLIYECPECSVELIIIVTPCLLGSELVKGLKDIELSAKINVTYNAGAHMTSS